MNYKVAIITGASRGIGKACAIALARLGYQTVLIARNEEKLKKVVQEIMESAGSMEIPVPVIYPFDLSNPKLIESTVSNLVKRYRHIDVLVNNAGIYRSGTSDISLDDFEEQIRVNLTAAFALINQIVPVMKAQGYGHIFNVASRAGKIGFADSGGYSAAKFGLVGLNESLYRELAGTGISTTALCPGWVDTDMAYEAGTPIGAEEMIQTSDIAKTMEWILNLSPNTRIKEVVIESAKSIH